MAKQLNAQEKRIIKEMEDLSKIVADLHQRFITGRLTPYEVKQYANTRNQVVWECKGLRRALRIITKEDRKDFVLEKADKVLDRLTVIS